MIEYVGTITRENLPYYLENLEIPSSYVDKIKEKNLKDDDAAKWVYTAFVNVTSIPSSYNPTEIAAIVKGLNSTKIRKRVLTFNKFVGLPATSDINATSGAALAVAGILKSYIWHTNSSILKNEFKHLKENKENATPVKTKAHETKTKTEPSTPQPETITLQPNFEEIVKLILTLDNQKKKSLFYLLKQTIE